MNVKKSYLRLIIEKISIGSTAFSEDLLTFSFQSTKQKMPKVSEDIALGIYKTSSLTKDFALEKPSMTLDRASFLSTRTPTGMMFYFAEIQHPSKIVGFSHYL